jgi:hypothetical protein
MSLPGSGASGLWASDLRRGVSCDACSAPVVQVLPLRTGRRRTLIAERGPSTVKVALARSGGFPSYSFRASAVK